MGGRETAASGLVSVIPHACMIVIPWRSWYFCWSDSGTAEPPLSTKRIEERSVGWLSRYRRMSLRIVGTAPEMVGRSASMSRHIGSTPWPVPEWPPLARAVGNLTAGAR